MSDSWIETNYEISELTAFLAVCQDNRLRLLFDRKSCHGTCLEQHLTIKSKLRFHKKIILTSNDSENTFVRIFDIISRRSFTFKK